MTGWKEMLELRRWEIVARRAYRDEPPGPRRELLRATLVQLRIRIINEEHPHG